MAIELDKKEISKYVKIIKRPTELQIKDFIKKNNFTSLMSETFNFESFIKNKTMLPPVIEKLYNLFYFVTKNKRLKVLEFGSGYSTIILANALKQNKKNFLEKLNKYKHIRFSKNKIDNTSRFKYSELFTLNSVDDQKKWLNKTKSLIKKHGLSKTAKLIFSKSTLTKFNDRFCYNYCNIPFINSDFIYIDGPTMGIFGGKNNFEPISCDVLQREYIFYPGTIIVVDGMPANACFMKNNFQRNWIYYKENNISYFYLNEKPLGIHNQNQLKFYKDI